jgi:hypothetical protein
MIIKYNCNITRTREFIFVTVNEMVIQTWKMKFYVENIYFFVTNPLGDVNFNVAVIRHLLLISLVYLSCRLSRST